MIQLPPPPDGRCDWLLFLCSCCVDCSAPGCGRDSPTPLPTWVKLSSWSHPNDLVSSFVETEWSWNCICGHTDRVCGHTDMEEGRETSHGEQEGRGRGARPGAGWEYRPSPRDSTTTREALARQSTGGARVLLYKGACAARLVEERLQGERDAALRHVRLGRRQVVHSLVRWDAQSGGTQKQAA